MPAVVVAAVFDARDVEALAAFWAVVVGTTSLERWSDARGTRFVQVAGEPVLLFQEAPDPAGNGSLHLDVTPPAGTSQAEEVVRLVAAGAGVLSDDPDLPWVVLADPEGNRFCVLPPRDGYPAPVPGTGAP